MKTEGGASAAGAGGLARAFGKSGSDTRDVFNLIQNQIEDMKQIEDMDTGGQGDEMKKSQEKAPQDIAPEGGAGGGDAPSTMTLALEIKSSSTSDTLQLGRMPDQEFKYFRLVLMQVAKLN